MFFLFSGEGPTDCGRCEADVDQCEGAEYAHGPMTKLADQIVEARLNYSPLEFESCGYVSEGGLSAAAESLKARPKSVLLPGKKRPIETGHFYRNARALSRCAAEIADERDDDVIAILFRDSDGTRSAGRGLWDNKVQSMRNGFAAEGFSRGVPMVPKPKSEAWLLCALRNPTEAEALKLEKNSSGNDNSPKALKKQLAALLKERGESFADVVQLIEDGKITPETIDKMPSFQTFRHDLESVL